MSDISFDGLGAFLVFLGLTGLLIITILFAIVKLLLGRKSWPRQPFFGMLCASVLAMMILSYLIELSDNGPLKTKEFLDQWSLLIAAIIAVGVAVASWLYYRKIKRKASP